MKQNEQFETRLSLVFYFLKGAKRYFAAGIIFAFLVSFIDLINPKIISYTVDTILNHKDADLPKFVLQWIDAIGGPSYLREHLYIIAFVVIVTALLGALSRYCFQLNNSKGAEVLVQRMRDTLFERIMELPSSWHNENHTGDIIQRCTSDVETIKGFLSEQLTGLFRVLVLFGFAIYFMVDIHPTLSIIALVMMPLVVIYSILFHGRIGSAFEKADTEEGVLSSIAQENISGVRVVRAFGQEIYEQKRFEKQNADYTKLWVDLMRIFAEYFAFSDFFSYFQILTILVAGAYYCVQGSLSAGNYIAFLSYNGMLTWQIRSLGRMISNLSRAGISVERLRYIMNSLVEVDLGQKLTPDMHQDIVFDHVSFRYDDKTPDVLKDISFTIPAGKTIGIIGKTGSGKTTLVSLLDRLYECKEGVIRVGDIDIRDIKLSWLRRQIGMILQEPFLFSRTLKENISIGVPDADMSDISEAVLAADLTETIEGFHDGYDTFVGERGVTLSGGQKQRTAIAQMLMRKPAVMIFDDSLSAVDARTDAIIRANLKQYAGKSTIIFISHRITTIQDADLILVMDDGEIIQQGTHDQLIQKEGLYKRIYDLQVQEEML